MKCSFQRGLLILCFILFAFTIPIIYSENKLSTDQIKAKIDRMLISNEYHYQIIKVSDIINNLCVVAISPPYREFPNIVIFKLNPDSSDIIRVYEGLCLGIQDKPSTETDLHTLGVGIDMQSSQAANEFAGSEVQKMMELSNQHGLVAIPYQYFIHMHPIGGEAYTIDKTKFYDFAVQLLGNHFKDYPKENCMMYDMPNLRDLQFSFQNGKYIITGTTDNQQVWQVTLDGVDQDHRYLINKKIEVKRLSE